MKKLCVILIAILLSSCVRDAQEVVANGNFEVEYLFEQNGCKMYRFKDGGRYIYWSDCQGKTTSDYSTSNGKTSTTHHQEVITTK